MTENLQKTRDIAEDYYVDTPGNAETERLLVKIENLRRDREKQCILITSATLGEGKSTVATQMALASARNRKKPTLLVDFDLRRPRLHQIFGEKKEIGVADILGMQLPLRLCVKDTFVDNLKILTSGTLETSALEVFNSENTRRFFENAYQHFDYIIVDSPPVVAVSDPLTLAKVVDNVVFVIKAGQTPKKVVQRAIDMLSSVEVKISGIIINNMDNVLPSYYEPKYYGYEYYNYNSNNNSNGKR